MSGNLEFADVLARYESNYMIALV